MEGGSVARRVEVYYRGRHVGWRTLHDDRLALAALRALDKREARWSESGVDATSLLGLATEILKDRQMCEASAKAGRA